MIAMKIHQTIRGIRREFLLLIAGSLLVLCFSGGQARGADHVPEPAPPFATVVLVSGEVQVTAGEKGARAVAVGDVIRVGERIRTMPRSEAVLKTMDAGMVAIRPDSEFVAEEFIAEGQRKDKSLLRLLKGSLRIITGWIGKTNRADHKVTAETATIGIRGTDHEPYLLGGGEKNANYRPGLYDKVNRGGTSLALGDYSIDVDAGKVGFAHIASNPIKTRALMTLLTPVILDKVPDFYIPGLFEDELDKYSRIADSASLDQLRSVQNGRKVEEQCWARPEGIARGWLKRLDAGLAKRDHKSILALFSPEARIEAKVVDNAGQSIPLEFSREEFVKSTVASMENLRHYRQRRLKIEAEARIDADPAKARGECEILVKSEVAEQGVLSGKPFRFESTEEFVLKQSGGSWLAIKGRTSQH